MGAERRCRRGGADGAAAATARLDTPLPAAVPHPTPTVETHLTDGLALLERWLLRGDGDRSVPATITAAVEMLTATLANLRSLADLLPSDAYPIRLTPDTNALIDNPDLAAYTDELGRRYIAPLAPGAGRDRQPETRRTHSRVA